MTSVGSSGHLLSAAVSPAACPARWGLLSLALGALMSASSAVEAAPVDPLLPQLPVRNYTMEDGLPARQVFCSLQDADGYMWFGTANGAVRYDGARFTRYTVETGLVNHAVRALVEFDGEVWLTTEGGVSVFDGRSFRSYTSEQGLGRGIVWKAVEHDGKLYLGTSEGGLCQFAAGKFSCRKKKDGLPSDHVSALLSHGPALWIGTRGAGLARLQGDDLESYGADQGLTGTQVLALAHHQGVLWVGTKDAGVFRLRGERFEPVLPDAKIYSVGVWRDQLIWGTLGQGVYRLRDGEWHQFTDANGLVSDRIYSVFSDREGSLWLTGNGGVSKLTTEAFTGFLPGKNVLSIAEHDGAIWLGTLGEGLFELRADQLTPFLPDGGLLDSSVWALASHDDKLWIGTAAGLESYDGQALQSFTQQDGLVSNLIVHLLPDDTGIWITTFGGVSHYDGSEFRNFTTADGLVSNNVRSAARLGKRVCFGAEGGISCFDGSRFVTYGLDHGLSTTSVYTLFADRSGTLWVGTTKGLNQLTGERFAVFSRREGLGDSSVGSISEHDGTLLLGTNNGLDLFSQGEVRRHLGSKDGLVGREFNVGSILVDSAGSIWLGTTQGATRYAPALERRSDLAPPIHLERFVAGGVPQPVAGPLELDHESHDVSFQYAGLSFRDETDVRFSYRLEGYDKLWSPPVTSREVRYTNLPPGSYRFLVRARSATGVWSSAPASVAFRIRPPYWRTPWFLALGGLMLTSLLYTAVRLRMQQLRRRTEQLERLVEARTAELAEANLELKELSLTDPLTRLGNRRLVAETITGEVAAVRRAYGERERGRAPSTENIDLGFVLVDIDHFKAVNDTHGHAAGDSVLQQLAERLRRTVREEDMVVRWGGEEFLIICKRVNRRFVPALAERIAEAMRAEPFELPDGDSVRKTCSVGFSLYPFSPADPERYNHEEAIGFADAALYLAKHNGRDLTVGLTAGDREMDDDGAGMAKSDLGEAIAQGYVELHCQRDELMF